MGLLKSDQANIEQNVTAKTLDGLYFMIGEEEKKIRQDPVAAGSAVLKKFLLHSSFSDPLGISSNHHFGSLLV